MVGSRVRLENSTFCLVSSIVLFTWEPEHLQRYNDVCDCCQLLLIFCLVKGMFLLCAHVVGELSLARARQAKFACWILSECWDVCSQRGSPVWDVCALVPPNEVSAQQLSLSSGRATGILKRLSELLRNVSFAQELSFYVHYFVFCHILWII